MSVTHPHPQPPVEIAPQVQLRHFWSGEGNLSYLVVNQSTREAVLIDPDLEILGTYLLLLDRENLTLVASIDTHTHAEHATAAPLLRNQLGADYLMNHRAPSTFVSDRLNDQDQRTLAGISFSFFHAPGHTPCLQVIQVDNHLFTGDSLFNKSCGRADLPGGDAGQQYDSLQTLVQQWPEHTVIHPGHDYNHQLTSVLGQNKRENPRLQFSDRSAFIKFMNETYADEEKPDDLEYYVAFNAR